jgi:hypothetical protein
MHLDYFLYLKHGIKTISIESFLIYIYIYITFQANIIFLKINHHTTKHVLRLFFILSEKHGIKTTSIDSFKKKPICNNIPSQI